MSDTTDKPRPAATVVVVRDAEPLPEVFMLRRHEKAVFASHYVSPGGVLEDCDRENHDCADGPSAATIDAWLGVDNGRDYYSAAIREAFEEAGVLFARDRENRWAFTGADTKPADIDALRVRLNDGSLAWSQFLRDLDLRPAYDALHYVAYWVTPRERRRRFSTRFFLGVLPRGQEASHDDAELIHSCWMTARDALEAGKRGEIKLMYPTLSTLRDIAGYDNVDDIEQWARRRAESGVARQLPAFVEVDGEHRVVMPGSPHYPGHHET